MKVVLSIDIDGTIAGYGKMGHKHAVVDLTDVYSKTGVDSKIAAVGGGGNSWDSTGTGWSWTTPKDSQLFLKQGAELALFVNQALRKVTFEYDVISETWTFTHCDTTDANVVSGMLRLSTWAINTETSGSFIRKFGK